MAHFFNSSFVVPGTSLLSLFPRPRKRHCTGPLKKSSVNTCEPRKVVSSFFVVPSLFPPSPDRGSDLQRCRSRRGRHALARRSCSVSPSPPAALMSGKGARLDEPAIGQDTVYDGAAEMHSTAYLFGNRGGRYSVHRTYGSSFQSATPRPWQKPAPNKFPNLGPGQYEPNNDTHHLAATLSWQSRGRSGPTGYPFDASRRSLPFRQTTNRFGLSATRDRKRGAISREDVFVLASDARKESMVRSDFVNQLQGRALNYSGWQQPSRAPSRAGTSPGF